MCVCERERERERERVKLRERVVNTATKYAITLGTQAAWHFITNLPANHIFEEFQSFPSESAAAKAVFSAADELACDLSPAKT